MPEPISPAARRAQFAVLAAFSLAVIAPLAIWLDDRLIRIALLGQGVFLNPTAPVPAPLRLIGMGTALLPAVILGWGLVGLLPALRSIGRGALLPQVGQALHRLGLAVLLVGLLEPLGRMVLFAALSAEPNRLVLEFGISAHAVILACLGATLMALAPVLRSAAAALEENRGFV
jgi:hypothetical protein